MRPRLFRHVLVRVFVPVIALLAMGIVPVTANATTPAPVTVHPRSAHCHVTDGTFGTCPDGSAEWSDVPPSQSPGTNAWVYADQGITAAGRSTPDTFFLAYDECGVTAPLGPDQYFLVSFDSVEPTNGHDALHRYNVHVFGDGTIIVLENGVAVPDAGGNTRAASIDNQRGKAGFGTSPKCAFPHLVVEYQIDLTQAGGHSYSPDPLFWGGTPPACTVTIDPISPSADGNNPQELTDESAGTMNVAEHAAYSATVSGGPGGDTTYQWTIDGTVIKDYEDRSSVGFSSAGAPALTNQTVDFYWGPETGSRNLQVTVTQGGQTCSNTRAVNVERSTAEDRLAEHWWMTNHFGHVADEHAGWHMNNMEFGLTVCAIGVHPGTNASCYGKNFFAPSSATRRSARRTTRRPPFPPGRASTTPTAPPTPPPAAAPAPSRPSSPPPAPRHTCR
jgi:hypothetical protein